MKTRACATALLLSFCAATVPIHPALAQEKDAVTETARRRFQEGVKFFDEKRYEEARAAFLQAYALKHHPAVLLNLAQSELRSGHPLEAAKHFSGFIREGTQATATQRSEAEKGLANARGKIGRIQISVNVSGAELLVDNESVGTSPLSEPVDVASGTHIVEAKQGGRSANTTVTASVGRITSATLALEGAGASAAAEPGPFPAPVPPAATSKPANPEADLPKEGAAETTVSVDTGTMPSAGGRPPFFKWMFSSPVGLVGFGTTVIGLGVFGVAGIAAMRASDNVDVVEGSIQNEVNDPKHPEYRMFYGTRTNWCGDPVHGDYAHACDTLRDNLDKRDSDRTIAAVGVAAAGVGIGITVVGYFLTTKKGAPSTGRAAVVPYYSPHQAGLTAAASF